MIQALLNNLILLVMVYGFVTVMFMFYFDKQPDTTTRAALLKALVWPVFCWELFKKQL